MFGYLDWLLNASRGLSAIAEFLDTIAPMFFLVIGAIQIHDDDDDGGGGDGDGGGDDD